MRRCLQLNHMVDFCFQSVESGQGRAMYVSGSPGLGKSLTVRQAYDQIATSLSPEHKIALVNAFHLSSPSAVYTALLAELGIDEVRFEHALAQGIEQHDAVERLRPFIYSQLVMFE